MVRPAVIVVSHTHWDREWYQPFEVFRLRLCDTVAALLDVLDRDPAFRHFMLDGQTVCLDDVLALAPSLGPRLRAHIAAGRIGIGPWYVLQDEFLVGAESIVRNLGEGLRAARRFGRPMAVGYLPDAFGHIAQMPRILRGFGIETAVVWRGVGDAAPGSEWRWRAPDGSEVLCLFLPGGYGNAHALGGDEAKAHERLRADLGERAAAQPRVGALVDERQRPPAGGAGRAGAAGARSPAPSRAWISSTPRSSAPPSSYARASTSPRCRSSPASCGGRRRRCRCSPARSRRAAGRSASTTRPRRCWCASSSRSSRRRRRRGRLSIGARRWRQAWRLLLQCQPHDSICGCSIDEVHREIATRLRGVDELGRALLGGAVQALAGAPTPDFALHEAIALANPHPFAVTAAAEVAVQRLVADGPFRLVGPDGEVGYEIVARSPTDGPGLRPAEWLRLRVQGRDLPPLGLRVLALEPGAPAAPVAAAADDERRSPSRAVPGGLEIVDAESGLRIVHTFEDEDDRGDLYDFCPRQGSGVRSSRDVDLGVRVRARAVGRRVEIEVDIDNRAPDHRLRARFALSTPPSAIWTETAFGWLERARPAARTPSRPSPPRSPTGGRRRSPSAGQACTRSSAPPTARSSSRCFAPSAGCRAATCRRAPGHAGYNVPTPDAQGLGRLTYRYAIAVGPDAVRALEPATRPAARRRARARRARRRAVPLGRAGRACASPSSSAPTTATTRFLVRLCGPPDGAVTARVRLFRPFGARHPLRSSTSATAPRCALDGAGDELAVPHRRPRGRDTASQGRMR